jgi:hypothetical protein
MPDLTEEEFLRRVRDPDLIEARAKRHARHRAEKAGLTEEQLRDREDEEFRRTMWTAKILGLGEDQVPTGELLARLRPGRRRKRPVGPPAGSRTIPSIAFLEPHVDQMRRDGMKFNQARLAAQANVAKSTLSDWLADHPGAWDQLVARYRGLSD